MLNNKGTRELAYLVKVGKVMHHPNADRLDVANIINWTVVVGRDEVKEGDFAVFFEVDSLLPEIKPFSNMDFLVNKHYKVQPQKIRGVASQGLIVPIEMFGWTKLDGKVVNPTIKDTYEDGQSLTDYFGVKYYIPEDNTRKANYVIKEGDFHRMINRYPKFFKSSFGKWLIKFKSCRKLLSFIFGRKINKETAWPTGRFPGVNKTDQERCENIPNICNDKSEYIRTQKCDGSSGTYILERQRKNKFEFYVCSRNVRMVKPDQKCFYDEKNYYWEAALKYDIENKMKDYLLKNPSLSFVCWQGEICAPGIQKNPQNLTNTHLFCFHMTDDTGRYDIRDAAKIWKSYDMEIVPIDDNLYTLPDDFEEFKLSADGFYDSSVCEGNSSQPREGYVYYKVSDPTYSFKNVSREYLLGHGE